MKKFDQKENDIIYEIVSNWKNNQIVCLADIVDKYLVDIDVVLDYQNSSIELQFDNQSFSHIHNLPGIALEKAWLLMRFANLLKYLHELNFIYLYQQGNNTNGPARFGQLITSNSPPINYQITDPVIVDFLLHYSYRKIIVGQILIDYVDNDFKTDEQKRHEENIKIAGDNLATANESLIQAKKSVKRSSYAISVSIVLGILSIIITIFLSQKQPEIKISRTQFETVIKSLQKIDSLDYTTNKLLKKQIDVTTMTHKTKPVKNIRKSQKK